MSVPLRDAPTLQLLSHRAGLLRGVGHCKGVDVVPFVAVLALGSSRLGMRLVKCQPAAGVVGGFWNPWMLGKPLFVLVRLGSRTYKQGTETRMQASD